MRLLIVSLFVLLLSIPAMADSEDKTITRTGTFNEDTYLAGERLIIDATIDGDLIIAAGDINVSGQVSGDVMAAGGEVSITATLADDLRAAGGDISLCSKVDGDVVLAGGDIDICKDNVVRNKLLLAGGDVTIDGVVEQDVKIRAGIVRLAGTFLKDVNIVANSIEVINGSKIGGDLNYKSPNPAKIQAGAVITGRENHTIGESWWGKEGSDLSTKDLLKLGFGFFFVVILGTLLTAFVLSKLLPEAYSNSDTIIRTKFLPSIAVGLLVALITPFVLILLGMTTIGIPLACIGLLIYLLLLVTGSFASLLFIANTIFRKLKPNQTPSLSWQLLSILAAIVLLLIVGFIPLLGGVALFLLNLTGIGAFSIHWYANRTEKEYRL